MGNFIDKTFTVIADILLKVLPASKQEKQAFSYYWIFFFPRKIVQTKKNIFNK